ncbi:MAG: GNAT family N-acetyltransferase [Proteobacteria bacterium]|nr:GNAT family N-acetyltransferase [Pseudomonadota bacterium]
MIEIVDANLSSPEHADAIVYLLNDYASDPMGGGDGLSSFSQANLVPELRKRHWMRVLLAFVDGEPAGLAICIEGFSTFACKPLLNIHDLAVAGKFRGQGVAKQLLARIEAIARGMGCCKITLEVLEGNTIARSAYEACGYAAYQLDPEMGRAMFWQNILDAPA